MTTTTTTTTSLPAITEMDPESPQKETVEQTIKPEICASLHLIHRVLIDVDEKKDGKTHGDPGLTPLFKHEKVEYSYRSLYALNLAQLYELQTSMRNILPELRKGLDYYVLQHLVTCNLVKEVILDKRLEALEALEALQSLSSS